MTKSFSFILFSLILSPLPVLAADLRAEHIFNISGKVIGLTPELLDQFRSNWRGIDELGTSISKADAQWTLDFISISVFFNHQECKELEFKETVKLSNKAHTYRGMVIKSGRYDELWNLVACGSAVVFRVVEPEGTGQLMVYEIDEKAF